MLSSWAGLSALPPGLLSVCSSLGLRFFSCAGQRSEVPSGLMILSPQHSPFSFPHNPGTKAHLLLFSQIWSGAQAASLETPGGDGEPFGDGVPKLQTRTHLFITKRQQCN